jgi:hypothetical protein
MGDIDILDMFKVVFLIYTLVVSWIKPEYLLFIEHSMVQIFWIASILYVVLLVDIVLGVVMAIAFISTLVKVDTKEKLFPIPLVGQKAPETTPEKTNEQTQQTQETKDTQETTQPLPPVKTTPAITHVTEGTSTQKVLSEEHTDNIKPVVTLPQNDMETTGDIVPEAQKAIDRYVVEQLLEKASNDHVIPENYQTFVKPLGLQYSIQGIEKDIVGYNYTD